MQNLLLNKFFYNLEYSQIFGFITAMLLSYLFTPVIRSRAIKLGFLDQPSARRIHDKPIPRLGGVSIYISLFLTSLIFIAIYLKYDSLNHIHFPLFGILAGGTVIFLLGLLDDIEPVLPLYKLLIQILAASLTWYLGVRIEHIVNPLYHADFHFFTFSVGDYLIGFNLLTSYLVTILWIIIITNAINLLDGMDGLSTGVSLISAIAIWAISMGKRIYEPSGALMAATLSGGLLGFLRWNFNPARIFLGDSGSYLTGFILSSLAICCVLKSVTLAIMTPMIILIFALPILDTLLAVIRRLIGKKSILEPDKGHLHHRVLAFGFTQKNAAYLFYIISIVFGMCATYIMSKQTLIRFIVLIVFVLLIMGFFTFVINWKRQKVFKGFVSKD